MRSHACSIKKFLIWRANSCRVGEEVASRGSVGLRSDRISSTLLPGSRCQRQAGPPLRISALFPRRILWNSPPLDCVFGYSSSSSSVSTLSGHFRSIMFDRLKFACSLHWTVILNDSFWTIFDQIKSTGFFFFGAIYSRLFIIQARLYSKKMMCMIILFYKSSTYSF